MPEQFNKLLATCPYCQHEHSNCGDWDLPANGDEEVRECSKCGREFSVGRILTATYDSYEIDPLNRVIDVGDVGEVKCPRCANPLYGEAFWSGTRWLVSVSCRHCMAAVQTKAGPGDGHDCRIALKTLCSMLEVPNVG